MALALKKCLVCGELKPPHAYRRSGSYPLKSGVVVSRRYATCKRCVLNKPSVDRTCTCCGVSKLAREFSRGRDSWCTRCLTTYKTKIRIENKLKGIGYLGGKCKDCQKEYPYQVFDFHHRDPSEKDREACRFTWHKWERLKQELDKCDLLCANCHRLRHAKEQNELS